MSRVDVVAVLQSESMRLAEAGEHRRGDRLIEASNAVAELIERTAALLQVTDPETLEWQDLLNALRRVQGNMPARLTAEQGEKAS